MAGAAAAVALAARGALADASSSTSPPSQSLGSSDELFAAEVEAGGAAELAAAVAVATGAAVAALPPEELPTPGSWVMETSCEPSAIGPLGLAGQEPAGFRGVDWPKGMVPGEPTLRPPTKVCSSALWNWHWKRPVNSAFVGAVWQ